MKLFKFLILPLALNFNYTFSYSQGRPIGANLGLGYGIGNHVKTGGLDFVIGRYNETRTKNLTDRMKIPHFFQGFNIAMDVYYPKGLLDFEYIGRRSDVWAKGTYGAAGEQRRDFRYKVNSWNMGYGKKLNTGRSGAMGPYLGADFSFIVVKNYTRVYQTSASKPEFQKINWDINMGFSPFLQFVGNRFTAKIQYQMMFMQANYWDVNTVINSNTWFNDEYDDNKGKTSSLSLCLRFNLLRNKSR